MGIWGNNWDNSYAAYNATYAAEQIITYTNTSIYKERIKSITMPMGTGSGEYTAGSDVTGDGSPITFYVYANGDSTLSSNRVIVSNVVGVASGSTGTYPPTDTMVDYTITFDAEVIVDPGDTIYFTFASNAEQTGSQVFVWDNTQITGDVIPAVAYVWKYNKSTALWELVAEPKRYNGNQWESIQNTYAHTNSVWNSTM